MTSSARSSVYCAVSTTTFTCILASRFANLAALILFGHGEPVEDNLLSWADPRRVGNAHLPLHREDFNAKRKQVPGPAVTRG